MAETALLAWCFVAGLGLGLFFFGGLWLTVRRLPTAKLPGLWMMVSSVARSLGVLAGFYLVMSGRWDRLLSALIGFTLIRFIMACWSRRNMPGDRGTYGVQSPVGPASKDRSLPSRASP